MSHRSYSDGWPAPGGGRPRPRARRGSVLPKLVLALALGTFAYVFPTPWAFQIGDRFTPSMTWDGFGTVTADNGGRYVLFTHLRGTAYNPHGRAHLSCSKVGGCDTLFGTATMCSTAGGMESFQLRGDVHAWPRLNTDGASTRIDLTGGSPQKLPSGWVVAFHGKWNGPELDLYSPDNSFTEVFTPAGAVRHVTSTADGGSARTSLHFGTQPEFEQACRALATTGRRAAG